MKIPHKILVVEDDISNQKILDFYLTDYEKVIIVATGEEAINEYKSNHFDLVLMDIRLQGSIDGTKTMKKMKELEENKQILVLAVTAYALKGDKEYFLQEGFSGYLAKPFVKNTFLEYIQQFLPPHSLLLKGCTFYGKNYGREN